MPSTLETWARATIRVRGPLSEGVGRMSFGSGAASPDLRYPLSPIPPKRQTSPEELIAAAQGACFTMMLSHVLTEAGTPPSSVTTECDATLSVGTGFTLINIRVQAAVPGITEEELRRAAATAEQRCPVSKALSAIPSNVETVLV
ncbi:OsmC family peroxiredoxin [Streptomyces sp. NPDC058469]|uniref:OsmC family peroxiredoxin n=1 Tax=Streptomyces sp. NPDC058469 TaxID=3346514 RepID=UPI003665E3AF